MCTTKSDSWQCDRDVYRIFDWMDQLGDQCECDKLVAQNTDDLFLLVTFLKHHNGDLVLDVVATNRTIQAINHQCTIVT